MGEWVLAIMRAMEWEAVATELQAARSTMTSALNALASAERPPSLAHASAIEQSRVCAVAWAARQCLGGRDVR
eukprot:NODE_11088_length_289_cov_195.021368.p4 GENE.NODE_11088_length_289_cov_195.021368~~NODE_11088_length_289_cov_195.021368.p4  ORF type:complete len:73 (+),score=19.75 NODE_11088_length_289_cov_195.021368:3-221(+)